MPIEKDYIDLIKDKHFKVFFKYKDGLKDFVDSYFDYIGLNKTFSFTDVSFQAWIAPDKTKMKDFFGDIIVTLNSGEILLIEMYSQFRAREYNKSYSYSSRAYSNQMKVGDESYENCKNVICLNLMSTNYRRKNNELINSYEPMNIKTFKTLDNAHIKMVLLRLDVAQDMKYNEYIHRFIKWLKIIYSKSFSEMEKIAKGEKIMQQSIEFIKRYCNSDLNHGFQDVLDEKVFEARELGEKRGEKRGIKLGEKRGIEQTAKKMLELNMDIPTIATITNLPENQILQLKKE